MQRAAGQPAVMHTGRLKSAQGRAGQSTKESSACPMISANLSYPAYFPEERFWPLPDRRPSEEKCKTSVHTLIGLLNAIRR